MSTRKSRRTSGFGLIEVMISITILAVGLLGLAALMAKLYGTTTRSRYMGTQALLASGKLEDLSRLQACDPEIAVPPGNSTAGSLTTDTNQTVNASATVCATQAVSYFDEVQMSTDSGAFTEINNGVTISQSPNGEISNTAPPASAKVITFKRRWVIEQDVPVVGARRVTVAVIAETGTAAEQAAIFQTSMVRQ